MSSLKREEHLKKKNGESITVEVTSVPVYKDTELLYHLVSWEDVTMRRRLEEQLLDISERERIRIGHDLHDGIGQELTAVGYLYGVILDRIRKNQEAGTDEAETIMKMLDDIKTHVRLLAQGLSPVNMDRFGIAIAVDELCRRAERIYGIHCTAICDDISIRDNSKATHIYYIIQESLNNAVKHAKTKNVDVRLRRQGNGLVFSIADDGIGIPDDFHKKEGLGIIFMQYRADIIGGVLNIKSRKPSGTIVSCAVSKIE